jgi:hypothetical protein
MTNILYIGPKIGKLMKNIWTSDRNGEEAPVFWTFIGRCASGIVSTVISQPLDVAARQQQIFFGINQG